MAEWAIEVRGLRKAYGGVVAVSDLSFTVRPGEVFGLLGPNGAGKTTTLECLEGLRRADEGELRVLGVDPVREGNRLRALLGVQLQVSALPPTLRCDEAMRLFCAYRGVPPRFELLERLGFAGRFGVQYQSLSTGYRRRLALALALAHDPPVVILDEPTAGLDVSSRRELHSLIRELRTQGTTVLLATHDMAEAESIADRVAIMLGGTLAALGTPRELTAAAGSLTRVSVRTVNSRLAGAGYPGVVRSARTDEYFVYYSEDTGATVAAVLAHIREMGDSLVDLRVERPSLEERFLEITEGGGAG